MNHVAKEIAVMTDTMGEVLSNLDSKLKQVLPKIKHPSVQSEVSIIRKSLEKLWAIAND
jgi:hypothetical protein